MRHDLQQQDYNERRFLSGLPSRRLNCNPPWLDGEPPAATPQNLIATKILSIEQRPLLSRRKIARIFLSYIYILVNDYFSTADETKNQENEDTTQ